MADAFTPNFNLTLPEIGGSFDTWGGKINANFNIVDRHLVFVGLIGLYEGLVSDIPAGWALCDGANGTPDLRDRFIVGAGGEYAAGDTGGAKNVTLTTGQMPVHRHTVADGGHHGHSASSAEAGWHNHSAGSYGAGGHSHAYNSSRSYDGDRAETLNRSYIGWGQAFGAAGGISGAIAGVGDHSHGVYVDPSGTHSHGITVNAGGSHGHAMSDTGGGNAHENRPPYYALAFIKFIGVEA